MLLFFKQRLESKNGPLFAEEETWIIKAVNRRTCLCCAEDLWNLKYMNIMRYYEKLSLTL